MDYVVEGARDPVTLRIPCTGDFPDLTGSTPYIEVYTLAGTIVATQGTGSGAGWEWEQTGAPGAAGDPVVVLVHPPTAGYPFGGFCFDDGAGFRARAWVTLPGETYRRPCGAVQVTVQRRSGA